MSGKIVNLSTERAMKAEDNRKWSVSDALEYATECAKDGKSNAVMVLLVHHHYETGDINFRKIACNLGYIHQCALLSTALHDEIQDSRE